MQERIKGELKKVHNTYSKEKNIFNGRTASACLEILL